METAAAASIAAADCPPGTDPTVHGSLGVIEGDGPQSGSKTDEDRPRSSSIASLMSESAAENSENEEDETTEEAKAELILTFPFLDGMLDDVCMIGTADDAAEISWIDPTAVNKAFKPQPKKSSKMLPKSILLDSKDLSYEAKAILASYWRGLTTSEMKDAAGVLKGVYVAYTVDNRKTRKRKRRQVAPNFDDEETFDGLSGSHAFVEQYNIDLSNVPKVVDEDAVAGRDLTQASTVKEIFKSSDFAGCGGKTMPMSILLDCQEDKDMLVMANWWRSLDKEAQDLQWKSMQAFYRAPTNSNDKLLVGTAAASAALGLPLHVGAASSQEVLDKAVTVSANMKTAQPQKRRKLSEPATSNTQLWDRSVRRKMRQFVKETEKFNNSTSSAEGANLAGRTSSVFTCTTNIASPKKAGFHGINSAIRSRPKTFVVARSMDSVERHFGTGWLEMKRETDDVFFSIDLEHMLQIEAEEEERKREGLQSVSKNQDDLEKEYEETENITRGTVVDASLI